MGDPRPAGTTRRRRRTKRSGSRLAPRRNGFRRCQRASGVLRDRTVELARQCPVQRDRRGAHQTGEGRLVAGEPRHRPRGVPAHRPGRHLPGARWRGPGGAGPAVVWPERMFSLLAGFVEAGESFETCVVREIAEEIGLSVRDVRYLGSQPWPFPRSLMVGFHAVADPDQEFSFNDGEISEAHWFTRDEVRDALAAGDWGSAAVSTRNCFCRGRFRSPGKSSSPGPPRTASRARTNPVRRACVRPADIRIGHRRAVGVPRVGTVRLPPLTDATNSAASGSSSMSISM